MWAAGVILYILLCGFPPFRSPERDQDELFNIIQLGQFEFLAPYWDNISDGEIWGLPVMGRRAVGLILLFQRVAWRGVWRVWVKLRVMYQLSSCIDARLGGLSVAMGPSSSWILLGVLY